MPYINQQDRSKFVDMFCNIPEMNTAGELNYALTMICKDYITDNGMCYQTFNDIIGALEGCKLEFYRRMVAPYENTKIQANGDVFESNS
jgi:hypothetical protein